MKHIFLFLLVSAALNTTAQTIASIQLPSSTTTFHARVKKKHLLKINSLLADCVQYKINQSVRECESSPVPHYNNDISEFWGTIFRSFKQPKCRYYSFDYSITLIPTDTFFLNQIDSTFSMNITFSDDFLPDSNQIIHANGCVLQKKLYTYYLLMLPNNISLVLKFDPGSVFPFDSPGNTLYRIANETVNGLVVSYANRRTLHFAYTP